MNIKKYFKISLGAALLVATQISCIQDDNWDAPEIVCNNKFDAATYSMADVVAMAPASGTKLFPNLPDSPPVIFDGYVVSSDQSGNFYKTISFQDKPVNPTVGLQIEIDNSGNFADFPAGAHIRIKANGLVLGRDAGVLKLGAVDPNYAIGRIPKSIVGRFMSGVCSGNGLEIVQITPTVVTLDQITVSPGADKFINTLVKVNDVQFIDSEVGKNLMDVDASNTPIDTDRHIENLAGKTAVVRTDGFFKPAYQIPNKSGDITFVVSKYNSAYQNVIRASGDINFTKDRLPKPATIFEDTFSSNSFATNGWSLVSVTGAETWYIAAFGNPKPCAAMSGFNSGNKVNEDWLISKSISLAGAKTASFTFETDRGYAGNEIEVYVTENYTGNPGTTTWTKLNPILDTTTTFSGFVSSGNVDFTPYIGKNVNIAFKYTSTTSAAATWEIDNVKVILTK
ncbi:MAG: DUF5689 domain-containing protein [Weeksellaceae bacterium]|nr:DUF5689 domain-containing protein [Weeksellaceae bacterium]